MFFKNSKSLILLVLLAFLATTAAAVVCQAEKGVKHCGNQARCQLIDNQQTSKLISVKQFVFRPQLNSLLVLPRLEPSLVRVVSQPAKLLFSQYFQDKNNLIHAPPQI